MNATKIEDPFGEKFEPELSKISAVYVIIQKEPENWLRNIKKIPIESPLKAGFVT